MRIPLHFKGAAGSPGVKTQGGIVSHLLNDVEVRVLAEGSAGVPGNRHVRDADERHEASVGHSAAAGRRARCAGAWSRRGGRVDPSSACGRSGSAGGRSCCGCGCLLPALRLRLPLRRRVAMRRRKRPSRLPLLLRRRKAARSNDDACAAGRTAGRVLDVSSDGAARPLLAVDLSSLSLVTHVMSGTPLKVIVGLGNPGPEHLLTRHNAGFWFVDALARQARRAISQPYEISGRDLSRAVRAATKSRC